MRVTVEPKKLKRASDGSLHRRLNPHAACSRNRVFQQPCLYLLRGLRRKPGGRHPEAAAEMGMRGIERRPGSTHPDDRQRSMKGGPHFPAFAVPGFSRARARMPRGKKAFPESGGGAKMETAIRMERGGFSSHPGSAIAPAPVASIARSALAFHREGITGKSRKQFDKIR